MTDPAWWNYYQSTGGNPKLIVEDDKEPGAGDKDGLGLAAFCVHVRGANWTSETRMYHALVRRLGGFIELTAGEVEPGPDDGLVVSSEGGSVRMRSDDPRPSDAVVRRFQSDERFHMLCEALHGLLVRGGGFSASDLYDALIVARTMGTPQGGGA